MKSNNLRNRHIHFIVGKRLGQRSTEIQNLRLLNVDVMYLSLHAQPDTHARTFLGDQLTTHQQIARVEHDRSYFLIRSQSIHKTILLQKTTLPYIIIMNQSSGIILSFGYYDTHQTLDYLISNHSAGGH